MSTIRSIFICAILSYAIVAISAKPHSAVYFSRANSNPYGNTPYGAGYGYGYGVNPGYSGAWDGHTGGAHSGGWAGHSSGSHSGRWPGHSNGAHSGGWAGYSGGYGGYGGSHSTGGNWHGGHNNYAPLYPQIHPQREANVDGHYDSEQVFHVVQTAQKKCSKGEILIRGECKKEEVEEEHDDKKGKVNIYFVCPNGFQFIDGTCRAMQPQYNPYQPHPPVHRQPPQTNCSPPNVCG